MPFYIIHLIPFIYLYLFFYQPEEKKDDLDSTDDRKPTEESHCAPNETQLGLRLDLLVSFDLVKGGRVKIDFYQL